MSPHATTDARKYSSQPSLSPQPSCSGYEMRTSPDPSERPGAPMERPLSKPPALPVDGKSISTRAAACANLFMVTPLNCSLACTWPNQYKTMHLRSWSMGALDGWLAVVASLTTGFMSFETEGGRVARKL